MTKYQDDIYRITAELVTNRSCDVVEYIQMHKSLHVEFCSTMSILASCWSEQSVKLAADDLVHLMHKAATEMAEFEYAHKNPVRVAA
jgi:hypothetical protein